MRYGEVGYDNVLVYLRSAREGGGVIVDIIVAVPVADSHNPGSVVSRIRPISNGLTAVAVRGR